MGCAAAAPAAAVARLSVSDGERLSAYQPSVARIASRCGVGTPPKACRYLLPSRGRGVVDRTGVPLGGTLAAPSIGLLDQVDGIEKLRTVHRIVAAGSRQERGEPEAMPVSHTMALRAGHLLGLAAVRWIRAGGFA